MNKKYFEELSVSNLVSLSPSSIPISPLFISSFSLLLPSRCSSACHYFVTRRASPFSHKSSPCADSPSSQKKRNKSLVEMHEEGQAAKKAKPQISGSISEVRCFEEAFFFSSFSLLLSSYRLLFFLSSASSASTRRLALFVPLTVTRILGLASQMIRNESHLSKDPKN